MRTPFFVFVLANDVEREDMKWSLVLMSNKNSFPVKFPNLHLPPPKSSGMLFIIFHDYFRGIFPKSVCLRTLTSHFSKLPYYDD